MAKNVIAQALGGQKKVLDEVYTVADVRRNLGLGANFRASIDGTSAEDRDSVRDGNYVSFSEAVKGAVVAGFRISK